MNRSFHSLAGRAAALPGRAGLAPLISSELLGYEVIAALSCPATAGTLVLSGASALRFCHGAPRHLGVLEFSGGTEFDGGSFETVNDILEAFLGRKTDAVIEALPAPAGGGHRCWRLDIQADDIDLPARLAVTIDNRPVHRQEAAFLHGNYDLLPAGIEDVLVPARALPEILSDMVLDLAGADPMRIPAAAIWDISWMLKRGTALDQGLLQQGLIDRGRGPLSTDLESIIDGMGRLAGSVAFRDELRSSIPEQLAATTIDRPGVPEALARDAAAVLRQAGSMLTHRSAPADQFML